MTTTLTTTSSINPRLAQLTKSPKVRNVKTNEFYVLVGNTGGEVNLSDVDEAETLRIFRHGSCLAFAYATALLTHLPIALFTVSEPGKSWVGHAAVQLPSGEFFDISGVTSEDEIRSYFHLASTHHTIYTTPEETYEVITDNFNGSDAWGYLLSHVNELGMLVTLHFVEQLLNFYSMPFDEELLRNMERKTIAYARANSKKTQR